jgi:hypothetical protein
MKEIRYPLISLSRFHAGRAIIEIVAHDTGASTGCQLPASSRVIHPLRPRALKAFDEFFFNRARDVYPRYDFARLNDGEFGATLRLD